MRQSVKWSSSKRPRLLRIKDLTATDAQPGHVTWIGLRPARLEPLQVVDQVEVTEAGLCGDHGRGGKRAITLFQEEHLAVIASFLPVDNVPAIGMRQALRRNIHIRDLNLSALRGVPLQLGSAVVEITIPCAPCSRMQTAFGPGGYNALRGHGGWCAAVLRPGRIVSGESLSRI